MKKFKTFKTSLSLLMSLLIFFSNGSIPAAAASSPVSIASEYEWEVLKLINQERLKVSKEALSITSELQSASTTRAVELPSLYDHTRPDGRTFYTVLGENSIVYSQASENIEAGQLTAEQVMADWMNSSGNKKNILSESYDYDHIGISHIYSSGSEHGNYWVQLFIAAYSNNFIDLSLYGNQSVHITLSEGQTLSDLNMALQCTSSEYGTCYLPLIDEMCTGFRADVSGTQTVTVNYQGLTLILYVDSKATHDAPTGLQAEPPSSSTASDGRITGVSSGMEYRFESASAYTVCTGSSIENLTAGTYYVRYKETDTYNASPDTMVVLALSSDKANQVAPTGLQVEPPSGSAASDGRITGVSTDMEYRNEGSSDYIACTGSRIENLTIGIYYVRYKETTAYNASPDTTVVLALSSEKADQAAPTGLQAVPPSGSNTDDGRITGVSSDMEYRPESSSSYVGCTGSSIENLTFGTYFVRYKETDVYNASPDTTVILALSSEKADQAAPTGLQAEPPSSAAASDGRITGVSADMEYRLESTSAYTGCKDSVIENLMIGTYYVRYKETDAYNASPSTTVVLAVSSEKADQAAPTGLQAEAPSGSTAVDGRITGVSTDMEYRLESVSVYTGCTGSSIENLTVGIYYVRYKETQAYNASPDTTVVLALSSKKADQAAPTGLQAEAPSGSTTVDGRITGVSTDMEYRLKSVSVYTGCTGSSIENLTVGIYYVRYKETDAYNASPNTTVVLALSSEKADQAAPTGLQIEPASDSAASDGRITGASIDMEYRGGSSSTYTACIGSSIENLTAGTYYVRYKETETHNPSPDTVVSVYYQSSDNLSLTISCSGFTNGSDFISLYWRITNPDQTAISTIGAYVYSESGTLIGIYSENYSGGISGYLKLSQETGVSIQPGTTYRLVLFALTENFEVTSSAFTVTANSQIVNPFTDVSASAWYYNSVMYAYENNIFAGTSDTTFSPGNTMTRAMMVQVLYNLEGASGAASYGFTDIKSTDWYADAVNWAAANNVVAGVGNNQFSPSTPITREEMAVILGNYCEFKNITLPQLRSYDTFSDQQKISGWAENQVVDMYRATVLSGMGDSTFSPKGNATRAQVAAMFMNFMEVIGT